MTGCTLSDFEKVIETGWELDFHIGQDAYHFERWGEGDIYKVVFFRVGDQKNLYESESATMRGIAPALFAIELVGGKSIPEVEDQIVVDNIVQGEW